MGRNYQTPDELAGAALESPEFKLFQEGQGIKGLGISASAEAEKMKLEREATQDTKTINESFGKRGLFFSGMRAEDVKSIVENLASSKLGVDRETAQKLLEQGQGAKEKFYSIASDIAKQAADGKKEALKILNDQGLTIGLDGKSLVPTLSALSGKRAEESQRMSEERLRLSEEAAGRAETRLQMAEDKAAGGGTLTSGGLKITNQQVGAAASNLNSKRGPDGWTDPNLYYDMFRDWVTKGGLAQDFTKTFPPKAYINPANKTLPVFLQNIPSNNTIIISPADINDALSGQ